VCAIVFKFPEMEEMKYNIFKKWVTLLKTIAIIMQFGRSFKSVTNQRERESLDIT
jgi:hypothetical protein